MDKKKLKRYQLDKKLNIRFPDLPKKGWVSTIRNALGMTLSQLGGRVGLAASNVKRIELSEVEGATTLNTLKKMAEALGCDFEYAFVPKKGLEEMYQDQVEKKVSATLNSVSTTMGLEKQSVSKEFLKLQKEDMKRNFDSKTRSEVWDES